MNDVFKNIFARRAVRRYKAKSVDKGVIDSILDAGRMAPSAFNRQPWKFYVVTDKDLIKSFSRDVESIIIDKFPNLKKRKESMKLDDAVFYGAPVVIFITSPKDSEWASLDVGMCSQNIMLAAKSLGLDSCPVGFAKFVEKTGSFSKLNIPGSEQVCLAVIIGYGDEVPKPGDRIKDNALFFS